MEDRISLELTLLKSIETDEKGNYIVWAEASNENLDFQDEVILQRALLDSRDYFLQNGIISYDHRHLRPGPSDKEWNPETYIIGEPLAVEAKGNKTFVKAKLYKSNKIVRELINKLRDGSTRIKTSVAGKLPQKVRDYDREKGKLFNKVVSVLWDELAFTFKPVNQTLSPVALTPAQFVKALTMGHETDSTCITGGRALAYEDLEGVENEKDKKHLSGIILAMIYGDITSPEEMKQYLLDQGYDETDAINILHSIVNRKQQIQKLALEV
jgi:hypothetical protein